MKKIKLLGLAKLNAILVFMIFNTVSARADWIYFTETTNGAKISLNNEALRNEELVRMWVMIDLPYKQTNGALSQREFWELNCKEQSFRILQIEYFPQQKLSGLRLSGEVNPGDWRYPAPGNVDKIIMEKYCKL
jgi:hypothetical protein